MIRMALLAWPGLAWASSTEPMSPGEALAEAAATLTATVTSSRYELVVFGTTQYPVTVLDLVRDEVFAGEAPATLELVLPGGPIGDYWATMAGAPELYVADHVLVGVSPIPATDRHHLTTFESSTFVAVERGDDLVGTDAWGHSVVSVDCEVGLLRAWPLHPDPPDDAGAPDLEGTCTSHGIFSESPIDEAMTWDALIAAISVCLPEVAP